MLLYETVIATCIAVILVVAVCHFVKTAPPRPPH